MKFQNILETIGNTPVVKLINFLIRIVKFG